jgi:hypothetical protein
VIADEEVPMNESASKERPIPTIWRVPDELWEKIEPILAEHETRPRRPEAAA